MRKLIQGIHYFQNQVFATKRDLFERLEEGQRPYALFITCSDSRIIPSLVTQSDPGDLFVLRNAGNIVPPNGGAVGGESATIEYAVDLLKVTDIIVCGHSGCGAVGASLLPGSCEDLPLVREWLTHLDRTREIVEKNYPDLSPEAKLNVGVQENVLVQLEHLRTYPVVQRALEAGRMTLHGWVYKFQSGEIFAYDVASGQFVPWQQRYELRLEASMGGSR
jgi:carbonic anhydrase